MKVRVSNYLAVIPIILGLTACAKQSTPSATANDLAGSTLIPFTSEVLSISGLVPDGWVEVKPGQFQRMPGIDPTLLGQVAYHGAIREQVTANWQLQERIGSMKTPSFTWDLYSGELEWPDAGKLVWDIALSESKSRVNLVILATLAEEHEALYDTVFVPAIDSLAPAMITIDRVAPTSTTHPAQGLLPFDTRTRPADGMSMVYVPAGEFEMGNTGIQWIWNGSLHDFDLGLQVYTDESPQHVIYLDAFWIDQTEVTVAMFRSFVEATGYETTAEREGWGAPWNDGPKEEEWPHVPGADWQHPRGPDSNAENDHPVVQVSWEDATAYCEWAGGQLPTEAQWEKAARGIDGRLWPWGNTFEGNRGSFCDAQCPVERQKQHTYDDGYAFTAPVGSFPLGASPYGALDMAGNVWEWVADWYKDSYYSDSPGENPTGLPFGTERTQRGGAWYDNESWVRTTVRHSTPPLNRCDDLGFRCGVSDKP